MRRLLISRSPRPQRNDAARAEAGSGGGGAPPRPPPPQPASATALPRASRCARSTRRHARGVPFGALGRHKLLARVGACDTRVCVAWGDCICSTGLGGPGRQVFQPAFARDSGGCAQVSLGAGGRADMRGAAVRAAVEARGPSEDEEAAPLAEGGPRRSHMIVIGTAAPPRAGPACRHCEQRRRSHAR